MVLRNCKTPQFDLNLHQNWSEVNPELISNCFSYFWVDSRKNLNPRPQVNSMKIIQIFFFKFYTISKEKKSFFRSS